MNATQMEECIAFMDLLDPAGSGRIKRAGRFAAMYWAIRHWDARYVATAALVACEVQCVVEAFRAERMGGVFIGGRT